MPIYRVNLVNDSSCLCGWPLEDAIHYFLECPLYLNFRVELMRNTQFVTFSIENILFGNETLSDEQNKVLFRNVHSYIKKTKRFRIIKH